MHLYFCTFLLCFKVNDCVTSLPLELFDFTTSSEGSTGCDLIGTGTGTSTVALLSSVSSVSLEGAAIRGSVTAGLAVEVVCDLTHAWSL